LIVPTENRDKLFATGELAKSFIGLRLALIEYAADHTLDELLARALDEVGALVDSPIGFYHFVESDQKTLSLQQWSTRTIKEYCRAEAKGVHYSIDQAGVWVDCVHQKRAVVHNDYASLAHKKGLPAGHARLVRELVVPVMRGDAIVAILGVGNKPTEYIESDAAIVSYFADVTWEIVRQKQTEEKLRKTAYDLKERVKELSCLYGISTLVEKDNVSLAEILQGAAALIPCSFQYPEITCARIELNGVCRQTDNFRETPWSLSQDIQVAKKKVGTVLVCLLEDRTKSEEGSFLREERTLLQGIAVRLANIIEKSQAEEALRRAHGQLELRVAARTEELATQNLHLRSEIREREKVEEELRTSEEKFHSLFNSMNEGVCLHEIVYDSSGQACDYRIQDVNPSYEHITGLKRAEVVARLATEVYGTSEAPYLATYAQVVSSGEPTVFETFFPPMHKYFLVSVAAHGPGRFTTVFSDITERKRTEDGLQKHSEKVQLFAYSVVHDLKNPALSTQGLARLLNEKFWDELPDRGRRICEQIERASAQIASLVEQINVFISVKETPLCIERVFVHEVFQALHEEFAPRLAARSLQWFLYDKIPETILADRMSMIRIFRNFIDNSLKYGGESLSKIVIGYQVEDDFHTFFVADDGQGVKEKDSGHIFRLFKRQTTAREIQGTGMGLAIVKEMAARHGGEVWHKPAPGKGVIFFVSFSKHLTQAAG